jgi:diaminopimelate epimerase
MKFTKMHGCGNDYIYINCFEERQPTDPRRLAKWASHRHYGIGADGLILIKPGEGDADATMEMYNADGSLAEMCGNGLRCVAKYVYDHGIARKRRLRIHTGAGPLDVEILSTVDDKATDIRLDLGEPVLNGLEIPTIWDSETVVNQTVEAGDRQFDITAVSMGNPHCVIYVDDVKIFPVETYGPIIERLPSFPNRVNVEFVEIITRGEVIQRTWERGSGETWACGTGAAAVCVAGVLTGRTTRELQIHLLGGDLSLHYRDDGRVMLAGPAKEVFTGDIR